MTTMPIILAIAAVATAARRRKATC